MERKDYTLEVHRYDRRYKIGSCFVDRYEYSGQTLEWMQEELRTLRTTLYPASKYRLELFETWVTRKNLMTGAEFSVKYNVPFTSTPASETYWSQ